MTRKQLKNAIEKLELKPGDIIVVRDEVVLPQLRNLDIRKIGIDFPIPILFAPKGIESVPAKTLREFADAAEPKRIITLDS